MTGLVVLALAAAWLFVSARVARYVARTIRRPYVSFISGVFTFFALAILPFVDEIVGRWQFQRLCAQEAAVWASPDAARVIAAKQRIGFSDRKGLIFPVREQTSAYIDSATGKVFYSVTSFHTPGGFLMRGGLGMGNSKSCWPETRSEKEFGLDIDAMLRRGER